MRSGSPARRKRRSYAASSTTSGVERRLLVGRREGERRARAPLVAEDEGHLARWPKALRGIRAKGRARFVQAQGAQQVAPEEAILARDLLTLRHPLNRPSPRGPSGIEADARRGRKPRSRKWGIFR